MVVDVGNWLKRRDVVLPITALEKPDWTNRTCHAHLTKEQVRNSPDVDAEKPVSRQQEIAMRDYFGPLASWVDSEFGFSSTPTGTKYPVHTAQVLRLRSTSHMLGYQVWATDGKFRRDSLFVSALGRLRFVGDADQLERAVRRHRVDPRREVPHPERLAQPVGELTQRPGPVLARGVEHRGCSRGCPRALAPGSHRASIRCKAPGGRARARPDRATAGPWAGSRSTPMVPRSRARPRRRARARAHRSVKSIRPPDPPARDPAVDPRAPRHRDEF